MKKVSEGFGDAVIAAWGNLGAVADVGFGELFKHGDEISLDHDDQVRYALKIGVLAGRMINDGPAGFCIKFEEEILNDE